MRFIARSPRSATRDALMRRLVRASAAATITANAATFEEHEPILATLEDARATRRAARLVYTTGKTGVDTVRYASVQHIEYGPKTRFIAFCHKARELRWFRVSRVREARLVADGGEGEAVEGFIPAGDGEVAALLARSVDGWADDVAPRVVSFRVLGEDARWVGGNLPSAGMTVATCEGGVRVTAVTSAVTVIATDRVCSGPCAERFCGPCAQRFLGPGGDGAQLRDRQGSTSPGGVEMSRAGEGGEGVGVDAFGATLLPQTEQAGRVGVDSLAATILPFTESTGAHAAAPGAESPAPQGDARYARGKALGQGGMGTVYEATDRQFGRVVALKEADARGPAAMARFSVEALVTANLEHPGVTPVYDRGVSHEGKPYYTMCRVQGRTLADAVDGAKTIAARLELLPVVIRVAQTLAYAHERGVVHRDIKPDNIIVGRHGETFVLDWGIAKVRGLPGALDGKDDLAALTAMASNGGATRVGSVLGTPAYMAPEQAAGRVDEIDERTDVFALGALLYHVMAGRPPYDGPTMQSLMDQAVEGTPPAVKSLEPGVPAALQSVIERAMAPKRETRFQTAGEVATALERSMTDALTAKQSPWVRVAINALTLVGALALGGAVVNVTMFVSTLKQQGPPGMVALGLFVVGLGLTGIEWRTRGRYALSSLSLVFAAVTLLVALAATTVGLELTAHAVNAHAVLDDPRLFRNIGSEGVFESLGSLTMGAAYAAMQLLFWAIVQRSNRAEMPAA